MSKKLKTVTLSYGYPNRDSRNVWDYRVEKIGNSVELVPMQMLTKAEVATLCEAENWTVIVQPRRDER